MELPHLHIDESADYLAIDRLNHIGFAPQRSALPRTFAMTRSIRLVSRTPSSSFLNADACTAYWPRPPINAMVWSSMASMCERTSSRLLHCTAVSSYKWGLRKIQQNMPIWIAIRYHNLMQRAQAETLRCSGEQFIRLTRDECARGMACSCGGYCAHPWKPATHTMVLNHD